MGLAGLHQQQQAAHFSGGGDLQRGDGPFARVGDGGEFALVAGAPLLIAEQVSAGLQQLRSGLQRVVGEALIRGSIQALLQGAQHRFPVSRRGNTEEAEVVDRQFQSAPFAWARL